MPHYPLLERVNSPAQLRQLSRAQLPQFCEELRAFLLQTVSQTGGHLASNLGVVELTVAIHYVFDTPNDNLVWDVGHQAYAHKILTGRRDKMATLKQFGGLSGFPKRDESPYDDFGVGHSSTSISAALGMAIADELAGREQAHIAVIGDGAMTAGMAFEALHYAAGMDADLLVILNDNDMSISPNHSGFVDLFKGFGFDYRASVDGHDVLSLVETLSVLKIQKGAQLLHVKTTKGKGYTRAEENPVAYHGVPPFDIAAGLPVKKEAKPTFTNVFSHWLVETATRDEHLIGITPAMCEGSGLVEFSRRFPDRYFDVAIAEQHAVTLAAGMACKGAKPVVAIYSTFLQRAYDQLLHDVALQNLNVLFAVDRAGIVGEDGATHAGVFDLSYARAIPNMVVMAPSDEAEMLAMLNTGYAYNGPALVRYPKACGRLEKIPYNDEQTLPIGKARTVRRGQKLAILVFGTLLTQVEDYAEAHDATLVDMRFVKPLDTALLDALSQTHDAFIVLEEGVVQGGVGEHIATYLNKQNNPPKALCLGIDDEFVVHGERDAVLAHYRLNKAGIAEKITIFCNVILKKS